MSEQETNRTIEQDTAASEPKAPRRVRTFVKIRRDQPSQIWDAKQDRLLVEFDKFGICRTSDPKVIKELLKRGYPEVPKGSKPMPTPLAEPNPFMAGFFEEA